METNPPTETADLFTVERNGRVSERLASRAEVEDFLDACGIAANSQGWFAALAGVPIDIDAGQVRFTHKGKV
jgi:hypothetical protein